ncbi:DegV family protein [Aquipuribacter sp. MA13-6]|uniref:DegV family protein n=1 Tax=unclassified Aquipuribacter TaxID=2635084 RepID=UPI003EF0830A
MARTVVVTDSTARPVPPGVAVVDLDVVVDGAAVAEASTSTGDVLAAVLAGAAVGTSRPSPDGFARAYADAAEGGASAVVSVHLSGALSGTVDAARLAADGASLRVEVVDTGSVGAVLSAAVRAAHELAEDGADATRVVAAVAGLSARSRTWVSPASPGQLQRGGRGSGAVRTEARGLAARPVLLVDDGRLVPLERTRTTARALDRLCELAQERLAEVTADPSTGLVEVVVQHAGAEAVARELVRRVERVVDGSVVRVEELSPVLAAHVGPGAVGVAVVAAPLGPRAR